jgi:hypothetical protein
LQRLDEMAGELRVTALKLSPGLERRDSLLLIDGFRDRIAAIQAVGVRCRNSGLGEKPRDIAAESRSLW